MTEAELRTKLLRGIEAQVDATIPSEHVGATLEEDLELAQLALAHAQAACALSEALAYLPGDPDPAVPQLSEDARRVLGHLLSPWPAQMVAHALNRPVAASEVVAIKAELEAFAR
jgi:hypothetical protein